MSLTDNQRFLEVIRIIGEADDPDDLAAYVHKSLTPAPEAGEVRLSEIARRLLTAAEKCCQCEDGHHDQIGLPYGTEADVRISRDTAREIAAALTAQPAGETRVEWGVKCAHDRNPWRVSEEIARAEVAQAASDPCRPRVVSRTVTSFPDVVGEWTGR